MSNIMYITAAQYSVKNLMNNNNKNNNTNNYEYYYC